MVSRAVEVVDGRGQTIKVVGGVGLVVRGRDNYPGDMVRGRDNYPGDMVRARDNYPDRQQASNFVTWIPLL